MYCILCGDQRIQRFNFSNGYLETVGSYVYKMLEYVDLCGHLKSCHILSKKAIYLW